MILCCKCGRLYDPEVEDHSCPPLIRIHFRWVISLRAVVEFGVKPPWYMKCAYTKVASRRYVYYMIPFNYVVVFFWWFNSLWNRWRDRESWIDREVEEVIRAKIVEARGYIHDRETHDDVDSNIN